MTNAAIHFFSSLLKDEKLPELYKRNRINSVDAAFDYDDE